MKFYYYYNKIDQSRFQSECERVEKHLILLGMYNQESLNIIEMTLALFYGHHLTLSKTKKEILKIKKDNDII